MVDRGAQPECACPQGMRRVALSCVFQSQGRQRMSEQVCVCHQLPPNHPSLPLPAQPLCSHAPSPSRSHWRGFCSAPQMWSALSRNPLNSATVATSTSTPTPTPQLSFCMHAYCIFSALQSPTSTPSLLHSKHSAFAFLPVKILLLPEFVRKQF